MRVDVVIDTICPWCYVGKRRLDDALALRPDQDFEVHYHPFLLAPDMPREGRNRKEYYAEKFGEDNGRMKQMTEILLKEAGTIDFQFDHIERAPNTVDSHRLIRWAQGQGRQNETVEAVFKAFFTDGRDIGDIETLIDIGVNSGLERDILTSLFQEDRDREAIQQRAMQAAGMGINGVPFYIFNNQVALSGAQTPEVIAQAIDKALDTQAA